MEKLTELLNEAIKNGLDFQGNDILKIVYYSETDIRAYYDTTARAYYYISYEDIISKRAGFIKWLVDNDKIDRDKVDNNFERPFFGYTNCEITLMLLSIQDNPIEFLCEILK